MDKQTIKSNYLQNPVNLDNLLDYIVDLQSQINELKKQKIPKAAKTQSKICFPVEIPKYTFESYLKTQIYPKIKDYVEIVFEHDLIYGIQRLFEDNSLEVMPIFSMNRKPNIFYVYEDDGWNKMETMDKVIENIFHEFSVEFNTNWLQNNQHLFQNDSFYKTYLHNYQKISYNNNMEKGIANVKQHFYHSFQIKA